jgi:hypothetical protein
MAFGMTKIKLKYQEALLEQTEELMQSLLIIRDSLDAVKQGRVAGPRRVVRVEC